MIDTNDQLPTFLLIGAARCGTTALIRLLGSHPEFFVTQPKEPHFFAFANQSPRFSGPGDDEMINRAIISKPDEYRRLFDGSIGFQHRGEGSVSSLYYSANSVRNILTYAPRVKLIVLLRDPVARAFSSYLYLRSRGFEALNSFEEGLAQETRRADAGWHHMWLYRDLGLYATQLEPFLVSFDRSRLLVILHDELKAAPQQTLDRVLSFLGARPFVFDTSLQVNRGGEPRLKPVSEAIRFIRRSNVAKASVQRLTSVRFRERVRAANLKSPSLSESTADELRSYYFDELTQLEEILGIDVTHWKDGRPD